jgi:hypothetical protein
MYIVKWYIFMQIQKLKCRGMGQFSILYIHCCGLIRIRLSILMPIQIRNRIPNLTKVIHKFKNQIKNYFYSQQCQFTVLDIVLKIPVKKA